jgi:hypothetical protein
MRKEDIEKAAQTSCEEMCVSTDSWDEDMYKDGFIDGAQWRISSVWHNVEEEPEQNAWFIAQIGDDCFDTFVMQIERGRWGRWCKGMNIKSWAYLDDLLPERKEVAE